MGQVVTGGLVWAAVLVGLPGCSSGAGGSSRTAGDAESDSGDGSAVDELDAVVGRLEAAADEVVAPLDLAEEVLSSLESLLASVGEGARGEVIRIVVSVINTGDAEISVKHSRHEAIEITVEATSDSETDSALPESEKVVLVDEPSEEPDGAGVVLEEDADSESDIHVSVVSPKEEMAPERLEQAKAVGLQLRDLLAALRATPERAKQLVVVAKDTLVAVPKLGAQAMASAQLKANNPLAGAAVRAEANADLSRIQDMVTRVQTKIAQIQKQAVSLPQRAAQFGTRAQQILMGAVLTPPAFEVEDGGALATPSLEVERAQGECPSPQAAPNKRPYQWGWLALSGVSGVAAAVGGGVFINAHQQLVLCDDPAAFGCANYSQLLNQRTAGLVTLSAGAAVMTTTFVAGFVANSQRERQPVEGASLTCGANFVGVQCAGAFW